MKQLLILFLSLTGSMAGVLAQGVTQGEYFWGTVDPGTGNGIALTAPEGSFGNAVQTALANAVPITNEGAALFNLRVREQSGGWGPVFSVVVNGDAPFVTNREIKVTQAEYFWGSDPGVGAGSPMFALDGNLDDAIETVVNDAIEAAEEPTVEVLSIRVRDAENAWGPVFSVVVSIEPAISTSREIKVSAAEYYFNDDPGPGNGTAMLAVNGSFNNAIKALRGGDIPGPITQGIHVLWMRARDAENVWGPPFGVVVNMDTTITGLNAQINGPTQFCQGDNLTGIGYSTPATGGSTYVWTATNGAVVSGQGTPNVNVNWNPSGNRTLTLTQCLGPTCETETLTLTVNPVFTINQTATICQGQSILLGGANQTQAGVYTDVFQTVQGCDSTVVTTLNVLSTIQTGQSVTLCNGESLFVGGANQTTSGTYVDTFISTGGCDSVVTTQLTVLAPILVNATAQVCQGGSIFLAGGLQNTPGNYTEVFTSINGCDSVVVTNLSILPAPITTETVTICPGQSYFVGGANQTQPGQYSDTFTGPDGCEAVVVTTLIIDSNVVIPEAVTICAGQSYFVGGANQTTSGVYTDTETDPDGCQITIETTLTVTPPQTQTATESICQGQSIFLGGANQTQSGVYTDFITNAEGCTVQVQTTLTVDSQIAVNTSAAICPGDSLFAGGAWQNTPGVYTDVIVTPGSCDSVITTTLSLLPPVIGNASATLCQGDSLFVGGGWQFTGGSYADTFTTVNGCDSLVITQLTVLSIALPVIEFTGGVLTTGQFEGYQWFFNNEPIEGATNQFLLPTAPGDYSVEVVESNGCARRSDPFSFIPDAVEERINGDSVVIYPNPSNGAFTVLTSANALSYTVRVYDAMGKIVNALIEPNTPNALHITMTAMAAGTYFVELTSDNAVVRKRLVIVQ